MRDIEKLIKENPEKFDDYDNRGNGFAPDANYFMGMTPPAGFVVGEEQGRRGQEQGDESDAEK